VAQRDFTQAEVQLIVQQVVIAADQLRDLQRTIDLLEALNASNGLGADLNNAGSTIAGPWSFTRQDLFDTLVALDRLSTALNAWRADQSPTNGAELDRLRRDLSVQITFGPG